LIAEKVSNTKLFVRVGY